MIDKKSVCPDGGKKSSNISNARGLVTALVGATLAVARMLIG
jgi:hypothetical protein